MVIHTFLISYNVLSQSTFGKSIFQKYLLSQGITALTTVLANNSQIVFSSLD